MVKIFIFFSFVGIVSCTSKQSDPNSITTSTIDTFPIKPVFVDTSVDEGWGRDIRLSFTRKVHTDSSIIYYVNSTYQNENIGFTVSVPKEGHVKLAFRSSGTASDKFIQFLNYLYLGKPDSLIKFNKETFVDCIHMGNYVDSLNQQNQGIYTTTHYCKLFFQGKKEDDYAELYFNINDDEYWIELKEKDNEYRNLIIKLLSNE